MRVILDTNVLIAALISQHSIPERILRAWRTGAFELVTSTAQLDELRRLSRYPKMKAILPAHRIGTMVNQLLRAEVMESLPPLPANLNIQDPNDAYLVAMAWQSQSEYLVTGDKRSGMLSLGHIGRTRVVKPAVFCEFAL